MQLTPDFDTARAVKSLLRRSRQGALATWRTGSGDPCCARVIVASPPDGSPVLLISRLALHTKNLLADDRVSLMLDERVEGDPLEGSRIMLAGHAEEVTADRDIVRQRYLNAHPTAEVFVDFKDFSFFRIRPAGTHLVAGFGRILDLQPSQFLTDISDASALLEAEQSAVEHMNTDHQEALGLYATRLLGAGPGDWRCSGGDPGGIALQAAAGTLRLDFPSRVTGPGELRKMLVRLAEQARAQN